MTSELNQVNFKLGELKGLLEGHGREMKGLRSDVKEIKTQQDDINADGCARGQRNGESIKDLEAANANQGRKDWAKLTAAAATITAVVAGIIEGAKSVLSAH
jgi:hypothetical protein